MQKRHLWVMALLGMMLLSRPICAATDEYSLTIEKQMVNVTRIPVEKITLNGGIPGPVLRFTEGDEAIIHVTNKMDEATSVHWHGLILPGAMDGVTHFNGFKAIEPGQSFTYHFPLKQAGTYWYHSHTNGQEQDGHYGSIIVAPKGKDPIHADRDYVVLVSDFSREDSGDIIANLKKSSDYYATARRTLGDFFDDIETDGLPMEKSACKPATNLRENSRPIWTSIMAENSEKPHLWCKAKAKDQKKPWPLLVCG